MYSFVRLFDVILHTYILFLQSLKNPLFGFLANSLLFVDTFLLLSSYIFVRLAYAAMEKSRRIPNPFPIYISRYIRLTPSYLITIGFYMTWFTRVANGPLWPQRIEREQESCRASWWLNLLYINNYINTDKLVSILNVSSRVGFKNGFKLSRSRSFGGSRATIRTYLYFSYVIRNICECSIWPHNRIKFESV